MKTTEWYVAKIKPAGLSIFNMAFYPQPDPETEEMYVYIKHSLVFNPEACKVAVLNGKTGGRMLTGTVAASCLEIVREATVADMEIINKNLEKLASKLSS